MPKLHESMQDMLQKRSVPDGWAMGIIAFLPKAARMAPVAKLRPIALQDVQKKWVMTVVSYSLSKIFNN